MDLHLQQSAATPTTNKAYCENSATTGYMQQWIHYCSQSA